MLVRGAPAHGIPLALRHGAALPGDHALVHVRLPRQQSAVRWELQDVTKTKNMGVVASHWLRIG